MSHDDKNTTPADEPSNNATEGDAVAQKVISDDSIHSQADEKNGNNHVNRKKWQNKSVWKRGLAMLGYGFLAGFVRMAITLIAIFQFFALLFAEQPNAPLIKFGQSLNNYLYQINQFLTVNSEEYPFPFADWPEQTIKISNSEQSSS